MGHFALFRKPMLEFRIAFRYLVALRKASIGQVLSVLAFLGIALGSMAMLVVLSAFNGFEALLKEIYHFQDPDIQIVATKQKTFELPANLWLKVKNEPGVATAFEVLRDKAALRYGDGQMVTEVVGMAPEALTHTRLDTCLVAGRLFQPGDSVPYALVSVPMRDALNVSVKSTFEYLQLLYPKRKKLLQASAINVFNKANLQAGGIVQIDENRLYAPIEVLRSLMDKPLGMNEIHVYADPKTDPSNLALRLKKMLGTGYLVKTEAEQHADLFKVMKIEKLFVLLALGFVILISSFNLFVSCSMLVINKKDDIQILAAMGMAPGRVHAIIQNAGLLVTLTGLIMGLLFGSMVCYLQVAYGLVPLGMTGTAITAYPVEVQWTDYLVIIVWVLGTGFIALFNPAGKAKKLASYRVPA